MPRRFLNFFRGSLGSGPWNAAGMSVFEKFPILSFEKGEYELGRNVHESRTQATMMNNHGFFMVHHH